MSATTPEEQSAANRVWVSHQVQAVLRGEGFEQSSDRHTCSPPQGVDRAQRAHPWTGAMLLWWPQGTRSQWQWGCRTGEAGRCWAAQVRASTPMPAAWLAPLRSRDPWVGGELALRWSPGSKGVRLDTSGLLLLCLADVPAWVWDSGCTGCIVL